MELQNNRKKTIGRVNYADYKKVGNMNLPLSISVVRFQGKDTTYETVYYQNPRLNIKLPEEVMNFEIPQGVEIKEVKVVVLLNYPFRTSR